MIGVIGHMSGGKTYTSVRFMLEYLRASHVVVSNVRLNCRGVTSYLGVPCLYWKQYYYFLHDNTMPFLWHELDITDYANFPCGTPRGSKDYEKRKVYIFLDEVSSLFDSMVSSADGGIQAVATWARHTEKRGQMLYLIMQFPSELHKRLRVHITEYLKCVNTSTVRIPFLGCRLPFFLRGMIVVIHMLADGETCIGNNNYFPLDKNVYSCYETGQIVVGHKTEDIVPKLPPMNRDIFYARQFLQWGVICLILNVILILASLLWLF